MIKLTPPMGWNSWNTFGENINEKMIFETADVMAESGLRDKGYEYLVIDDCWSLRERDENGRLVPATLAAMSMSLSMQKLSHPGMLIS